MRMKLLSFLSVCVVGLSALTTVAQAQTVPPLNKKDKMTELRKLPKSE